MICRTARAARAHASCSLSFTRKEIVISIPIHVCVCAYVSSPLARLAFPARSYLKCSCIYICCCCTRRIEFFPPVSTARAVLSDIGPGEQKSPVTNVTPLPARVYMCVSVRLKRRSHPVTTARKRYIRGREGRGVRLRLSRFLRLRAWSIFFTGSLKRFPRPAGRLRILYTREKERTSIPVSVSFLFFFISSRRGCRNERGINHRLLYVSRDWEGNWLLSRRGIEKEAGWICRDWMGSLNIWLEIRIFFFSCWFMVIIIF